MSENDDYAIVKNNCDQSNSEISLKVEEKLRKPYTMKSTESEIEFQSAI